MKIILAIAAGILLITVAVALCWFWAISHLFDQTGIYKTALKRCGHQPYAAVGAGEGNTTNGSWMLTQQPPNQGGLQSFAGYYCSQADAETAGLRIVSINGRPVSPVGTPSIPLH